MKTMNASKRVEQALSSLFKQGVRAEQIALELDVAFGTVMSWASGRRRPKKATVMQLQHLYGVKIL